MRKYVLVGVQGCGKGTQAKMLVDALGLVHISTGDLFRWHIGGHTKLGGRIRRIVASGELVPDDLVQEMMRERLEQHDWSFGFILDGFPRNVAQARFFVERYDVDAVVVIDVPDQVVLDRIMNRRLCQQCGRDFNLLFSPPQKRDTCDACGGTLEQRKDDHPDAVKGRLRDYHEKTEPMIELLRQKERVVVVDGTQKPAAIQAAIRQGLGLPPQPEK
jgi:adenylate kinase